jgi:hypothetical protein
VENLCLDSFNNIIVDGDNLEILQTHKVCFLKSGDAVVGDAESRGVFADVTWY